MRPVEWPRVLLNINTKGNRKTGRGNNWNKSAGLLIKEIGLTRKHTRWAKTTKDVVDSFYKLSLRLL